MPSQLFMVKFNDFSSFNNYIGLPKPLDNDIDMGYYNPKEMLMKSDPIRIDFYRISIKIDFIDKSMTNTNPIKAVFFNSPNAALSWDTEPTYNGMYLQLSNEIIHEHQYLFKSFLDYGQHEALFLTDCEIDEISNVFQLMLKYYQTDKKNFGVMLSYINVLISLVEAFYNRQFSTNPSECNRIVTNFKKHLNNYYKKPVKQLPSVQYFADLMGLSPNYLGDIVKHHTKKSAIENIHQVVIKRAKELLEQNNAMNNSEVAYELGFEYPNYFSKFFKKQLHQTPKEYRLKAHRKPKN